MAPPPPHLVGELVEQILLRFPPDDPASLVHAALVCKLWCRIVCGAEFRRRFREFHRRAAPMLGLLYGDSSKIRPTTSFRPVQAAHGHYSWRAMDARHGRGLLCRKDCSLRDSHGDFCVWDPVTGEQRDLPKPFYLQIGAVACAATAGGDCDHLDCRQGHFLVVAMGIQHDGMHLSVYSSEAGAWSKVTVCEGPAANSHINYVYNNVPGVLVGTALYIMVHYNHHQMMVNHGIKFTENHEIVKYDMATRQLSTVHLPSKFQQWNQSIVVMTDDDGGLGFVVNVKNNLQLWSKVAGADGDAGFVLTRAIDLSKVLPSGALIKKKKQPQVNGFADGGVDNRVVLIRTSDGLLYSIEINSSQVRKIPNCCGNNNDIVAYISFCTPTSRVQH